MKKQIKIALLLLLALPIAVRAEDYTYTTNNGTITIEDYIGTNVVVVIPGTINNLPVTSIGAYAFQQHSRLTSVMIPNSVTSIGDSAFQQCTGLTNVTIPNRVTVIGVGAFYNCTSLKNVTIPDRVTSVKYGAFSDCTSLTNITFGTGIIIIEGYAFKSCTALKEVTIPNTVIGIGGLAFYNCTSLQNVTIPNNVTNIGGSAFNNCIGLTNVAIGTSVASIGSSAFGACAGLTNIIIPNSVTNIMDNAFANCSGLKNVMIPDSVTSIKPGAFYNCIGLKNVTIPGSVAKIDASTFYSCTSLTNVTISVGVASIEDDAFYNCTSLKNVTIPNSVSSMGSSFRSCTGLKNVTISGSVTNIGGYAFFGCIGLTNVTISTGVTSIGSSFVSCTGLKNVTIPGSVTNIGDYAFSDCTGLTNVTISIGVTRIGIYAFKNCTSLKNVTIPSSVTNIGDSAFYNCAGLTGAYFTGNAPNLGPSVFIYADKATVYRVSGAMGWPTVPSVWAGRPTGAWNPSSLLTINGGAGSGVYTNQQQVTITATNAPSGHVFSWVGDTQYVASVTAATTTVIMPAQAVTLTATYEDIYCKLIIKSAYGTPTPPCGTNIYILGTVLTCSVNVVAAEESTNWVCSGWTGTGDVSASGSENSTGAIILTNMNSSLTWNWPVATVSDLRISNVTATQRPGTKLVDISYGVLSTKTNSVNVSLAVSNGAGTVNAPTVSGAVGSGVVTGAVKTMVWNAGADWNGNTSDLTIRILGQDAQGAGIATPTGRVRIPAGQNTGTDPDNGAYSITLTNALFMDAGEVTKAQWDKVFNWALTNGYSFANAGSGSATNHPVQTINWYDAARWCNARSKMDGFSLCYNTNTWSCNFSAKGYRLPTVQEWQYAARGGLSGKRFPWGDTITHSNDAYYSDVSYGYDVSTTRGFHPVYGAGTAPQGIGTTNGYGLYAMAGNVMEWCQDASGVSRAMCGGSWDQYASEARCTYKSWAAPTTADYNIGFRTVQRASSYASAETGSAIPVDTRDYQLIVSSERGTPVPNIGTNLYAWRTTVTGSVNSSVTSGLTNWTSAGWSGAGSVPVSGVSTNTGGIILTGLVSSIVWNWYTDYWLTVATSGSGSVNSESGWRVAGESLLLASSPSYGWLFMGWGGDVSGDYTATDIIVPMVRPVSITATFSDDADGDGLLNTNETALGTDPRIKDTDADGMNDAQELIAGTSPTNSASVLDVQLSTGGSANQVSWYGVSGRYYQLEYADSLTNGWTPKGTVITGANAQIMKLDISTGAGRFYRIRVSSSPSGF